jgi:murein DD-endopeptidase MepM/ murein hydrolase activator NlpD
MKTTLYATPAAQNLSTATPASQANNQGLAQFRQLLTMLLLSSFNLTGGQESSMGGLNPGNLMAPLMLTLLEKLLAMQVENEASPDPSTPHGLPLQGRLTQSAHPGHMALDIAAPVGTPVQATMDGRVVFAGWNDQGYGNLVILENGPYRLYFAHLSKISLQEGQWVRRGTVIGLSGNSGNSTGPHLHYEVRKNGEALDPAEFVA